MKIITVCIFMLTALFSSLSFSQERYVFPYSENQKWKACDDVGWVPYGDLGSHQYHMQYYGKVKKYHMGEDINGICGANTDEGAPLDGIGNGRVVFLDKNIVSGKGKRLYVRYSFPYAPFSGDEMEFDVPMFHLQRIEPGISKGSLVYPGRRLAYLGKTGTSSAHLHWEAQTDLTIPLGTNPYNKTLTIKNALKYLPPSMIVDDRRDIRSYTLPATDRWYSFIMQGNAPSSTMYLFHNGQRKSLRQAIAANWIPSSGILHERDGVWYRYNNVDDNFFNDGGRYAIQSLVSGAVFNIPVPRNNFQADRARLDMIRAVENDSRIVSFKTDTYGYSSNWMANWHLHYMYFYTNLLK